MEKCNLYTGTKLELLEFIYKTVYKNNKPKWIDEANYKTFIMNFLNKLFVNEINEYGNDIFRIIEE